MPIICLKKPGNRRCDETPGGGQVPAAGKSSTVVDSPLAPKVSSKPFVNPGVPPMKPLPSIKQVVTARQAAPTVMTTPPVPEEKPQEASPVPTQAPTEPIHDAPIPDETTVPAEAQEQSIPEDFPSCWKMMFEELFSNNHLIYYSLKDEVPNYENDIITIEVKNHIQEDQFAMRKKAIVEYWRNHFKLNVDEVEIVVNEQKEEKKVIISADDKLRNMIDQNANLPEFLKILEFRLKD